MTSFDEILLSSPEDLLKIFYKYNKLDHTNEKLALIAIEIGLKAAQITCAVGFNKHIADLTDIPPILGYENLDALIQDRNDIFINDVYRKIKLDDILLIYETIKNDDEVIQVMQYLLENRLNNIENRIEQTVNSSTIEKYKNEIRAIYSGNIAGLDFTEHRLNKIDSGFRALVNEVVIIAEQKIIPVGDIFFRNTILPEEKRKLLDKDLVPKELIDARLEDEEISPIERKMLIDYKQLNRLDDNE